MILLFLANNREKHIKECKKKKIDSITKSLSHPVNIRLKQAQQAFHIFFFFVLLKNAM